MTESELIRYWASLCENEDWAGVYSDMRVSEGGDESNKTAADFRRKIIDALVKVVLFPDAKPNCTELLKTKEDFGGYRYAVVDVENKHRPYDIVIQRLDDDGITIATLQSKTSASGSMFQKSLDCKFTRTASGGYLVDLDQTGNPNLKSPEEKSVWNAIWSNLPSETMSEVSSRFNDILADYDMREALFKRMYSKRKDFQTWFGSRPKIGIGNMVFDKVMLDAAIKEHSSKLSRPFSIPIGAYIQKLHGVNYIQVGNYLFCMTDENPLELKNRKGADIPKLEDYYDGPKATFYLGKGSKRYPLLIHSYGIKEKPNPDFVSLIIDGMYPCVPR